MPRYDASTAECFVFTYKDGALSAFAHDLKIRVTVFTIDFDDRTGRINALFDPGSLRVECAVRNGVEQTGTLDQKDEKEINDHIVDVLEVQTYREMIFTSRFVVKGDNSSRITGDLLLHGKTKEVAVITHTEGSKLIAEVNIHQPDFGIRPFSTLFGALRVKPGILVRVIIPAAGT